ncbi:tyrosine-protein phosphatase [Agromyces sp. LHK192]|uniref:tyrosine-protein phosphatase n=1 Tax=Agromyces sp. LHK192 TaxID=2498704 RepID=UPI001F0B7733|nr:tyrosine-protein phosphatase [Agromyces sp. LHK192]
METSTRIPVPGTYNFRDVGGMTAATGTIRHGVLYRADGLARLGEAGRERLVELDVRRVIDLRDDFETDALPDDVEGLDIDLVRLPVFEGSARSQSLGYSLDSLYERIVTQHAGVVAEAIRDIATERDGAVVVHCTAGKDRTGVVVALALLAVGVDREQVVADYEVTEANLAGEWLEGMVALVGSHGVADSPALRMLMGGSPRSAIESVIDLVEREHSSAREFLLASGVTLDELASLEARLVDAD